MGLFGNNNNDPPTEEASMPPPPPPQSIPESVPSQIAMFDPKVIDAADAEAQMYREKESQEITLSQHEKGEIIGKGQQKKKWIFLGILVTLAIIAIAVGSAMAAKNNNSSGSAQSASGDKSATSTEDDFDSCTPCSDIPTPFMQEDGFVCSTFDLLPERCGVPGSWWFDDREWDDDWVDPHPPQTYCQYSCFKAGVPYPDFNNCCADVVATEFDEAEPEVVDETVTDEPAVEEEPAPEVVEEPAVGEEPVVEEETIPEVFEEPEAIDENTPCVPCSDIPTEFMVDNGNDCSTFQRLDENCGVPGSWWFDERDWDDDWVDPYPPQTYCQYSCFQAGVGYPDFSPCCADVIETPDVAIEEEVVTDEPTDESEPEVEPEACTPCSDIPSEFMEENGVDCPSFQRLDENCGVPGSWWFDARDWDDDWVDPYPPQTYCQYSCFQAGFGYPDFNNCCADVVE